MEYTIETWLARARNPAIVKMAGASCPDCWKPIQFDFDKRTNATSYCKCNEGRVSIEEVISATGLKDPRIPISMTNSFHPSKRND